MTTIQEAGDQLEAVVKTVPGVRPYRDPGATIQPPGLIIPAPSVFWDVFTVQPTRASYQLYLVSKADDRTLERLYDLLPLVVAAINTYSQAAISSSGATPGTWVSGATDLPAYVLNVDVALI